MDNPPNIQIDSDQLISELHQLATFSDCPEPPPAVTRIVFSETDLRAREYLRALYESAGLSVRVDPIGNTFARWQGTQPNAPAIGTGSHTDAIPHAGMYDGTVGVLGGLEAIRALQRSGFQPRRSLELIMFTSEEPTRFGVGCTGSRAMSGSMAADELAALVEINGEDNSRGNNYDAVRAAAGFTGTLTDVSLPTDFYHAFVELHIEQGPELEAAGLDIGIVTAIAAPATVELTVTGEGGHAGAVLMPQRHDALTAAAEIILEIESHARSSDSADLVATVGKLTVHPGAVNSIPSRAEFTLDLRDIDAANRDRILEAIHESAEQRARKREVSLQWQVLNVDPPAESAPWIVDTIEQAAETAGLASQRMISRAYHDSLFMARVAPMGMIFIPCRGGVSHRPDEFSTPEQIAAGVKTLALTLAELAK